jgi:hypothetical protein
MIMYFGNRYFSTKRVILGFGAELNIKNRIFLLIFSQKKFDLADICCIKFVLELFFRIFLSNRLAIEQLKMTMYFGNRYFSIKRVILGFEAELNLKKRIFLLIFSQKNSIWLIASNFF